jgi:hypothetical protein
LSRADGRPFCRIRGDGRRLQVVRKQERGRFAAVRHSMAIEIEWRPETSSVCPEMTGVFGGAVGSGTVLQAGKLWVRFRPHYGPGVDSVSNRNEYQDYFLGGKGGRCVGLTALPPSCADCLEVWEPQPPGTLRACPGLYRDSCLPGNDAADGSTRVFHSTTNREAEA